jgi:hypothetical protein
MLSERVVRRSKRGGGVCLERGEVQEMWNDVRSDGEMVR